MIPYNRFEPEAEKPWKPLGELVRRALTDAPKLIGPDTEGLSPGFHKQSDGKLMYVPDMAVIDALLDPVYEEPEGDNPEDAGVPLDLQCDATRPVGFYEAENGGYWIKYWGGTYWSEGYGLDSVEAWVRAERYGTLQRMVAECSPSRLIPRKVLRARPDLDAMVQK